MAKVLRKPIWATPPPNASTAAFSLVPTWILKDRPVILPRQSAIAWPPIVILLTSTDGTKTITIGLSAEPRSPALGVMAFGRGSHFAAGSGVGTAVGGTAVGPVVGATVGASVGASVGGIAVGASVGGTSVAAGPHAARTSDRLTTSANSRNVRRLFMIISSLRN